MKIMSSGQIAVLNRRAGELSGLDPTQDRTEREFLEACHQVVQKFSLKFVRYAGGNPAMLGTTDGPQCEIYKHPATGSQVNLWISGNLGFDDQVD